MISISTFIWAVRGTPDRLPACLDRFFINIACLPLQKFRWSSFSWKATLRYRIVSEGRLHFFLFVSMNNQFTLKQYQCSGLGVLHSAGQAWNGFFPVRCLFIGPEFNHCHALWLSQSPCWILFKLLVLSKLLHGFL